jgi:hypothetical protein
MKNGMAAASDEKTKSANFLGDYPYIRLVSLLSNGIPVVILQENI